MRQGNTPFTQPLSIKQGCGWVLGVVVFAAIYCFALGGAMPKLTAAVIAVALIAMGVGCYLLVVTLIRRAAPGDGSNAAASWFLVANARTATQRTTSAVRSERTCFDVPSESGVVLSVESMRSRLRLPLPLLFCAGVLTSAACSDDDGSGGNSTGGTSAGGSGGGFQTGGSGLGGEFAVGGNGQGGGMPHDICKVPEDGSQDAPTCVETAPAESFAPEVQWTWTAPPADPGSQIVGSFITPLVGNFTDDNGDGEVDLCDTPDVIVTGIRTFSGFSSTAEMFMLSGDTGEEKLKFQGLVDGVMYPAFADIDNDGRPEVITTDTEGRVVAYANDGSIKWTGDVAGYRASTASALCSTIGIYDLEGDGSVEILLGWEVFDSNGHKLFGDPTNAVEHNSTYWCVTPTAADLDGDGELEVLMGHETFRADGTLYWKLDGFTPAHPQVANLDSDPEPEVFLTSRDGITVVEHDGTLKFGPVRPTEPTPSPNCWGKPAVVHDFDGDGIADIAAASCSDYTVYNVSGAGVVPVWTNNVQDFSGLATATGFDFLGDGVAEAIYADETQIYVFDGATGDTSLTSPRASGTLIEYPVVADIDNDSSAEILYVSNYFTGQRVGPTLTVLKDAMDRWIPARRIWNQYSYHVTNVREDGTIPAQMKKSWLNLNTFRTNSQISLGGEDCNPEDPPPR